MFNKRKRYIAVFLIKEQNAYTITGKKPFNPTLDSMEFKGNTYIINSETHTFSRGLNLFFFIEKDSKKQLLFVKSKSQGNDTEIVDLIMSKKIIKQLTSELGGLDFKTILLYLIIGLALGGMIGSIIGSGVV